MGDILRWVAVALSAATAVYMVIDGVRAFATGDYITPKAGKYAGQLGPWSRLVAAIGIEPRSTLMKTIFVTYGAAWLVVTAAFAVGADWAWVGMLVAAAGALWYLVVGTAVSALVIAILLVPSVRTLG